MKAKITLRAADERGFVDLGWLNSRHTFSFGEYDDPKHMHFRALRVINEDHVAPGKGFGAHPHRDMEIFSYVIDGALTHQDSLGNQFTINAGGVQKITAGSGISHSEYNASGKKEVHFLQIWIVPSQRNLIPSYTEFHPQKLDEDKAMVLIGSSQRSGENIIQFNQDVFVYKGKFSAIQQYQYDLAPKRGAWVQLIKGKIKIEDQVLSAGDGASIEETDRFNINAVEESEFILIDLA